MGQTQDCACCHVCGSKVTRESLLKETLLSRSCPQEGSPPRNVDSAAMDCLPPAATSLSERRIEGIGGIPENLQGCGALGKTSEFQKPAVCQASFLKEAEVAGASALKGDPPSCQYEEASKPSPAGDAELQTLADSERGAPLEKQEEKQEELTGLAWARAAGRTEDPPDDWAVEAAKELRTFAESKYNSPNIRSISSSKSMMPSEEARVANHSDHRGASKTKVSCCGLRRAVQLSPKAKDKVEELFIMMMRAGNGRLARDEAVSMLCEAHEDLADEIFRQDVNGTYMALPEFMDLWTRVKARGITEKDMMERIEVVMHNYESEHYPSEDVVA